MNGVEAKSPIGFKLLFAKQLIERRLVREIRVAPLVVNDVIVFIARKGGLDIEQHGSAVVGVSVRRLRG